MINMHFSKISRAVLAFGLAAGVMSAQAVDVGAAEDLAKASKCNNCHSVNSKKDGPAFKEIAAKYKGKADAEAILTKHVTTAPKVKINDEEEEHVMVKSKDPAAIKNLVQYVLTR